MVMSGVAHRSPVSGPVDACMLAPPLAKRARCGSRDDQNASRRVASPRTLSLGAPLLDVRNAKLNLKELSAVVVNLDRRPDRMEGCSERLAEHCPWLSHTRFSASDGKRDVILTTEVTASWNTANNVIFQKLRSRRKNWDDLDSYQVRTLELSAGERGCALSHIRAWRHCMDLAQDTEKPLLVLEDDAAPTPEFTSMLVRVAQNCPDDADVLYLGYSQAAEWRASPTPEIVESEYVWTTVGYIVWPKGARKMLSNLPVNQPVDNFMAALNASNELKSYCVRPKIVRQSEAWNINSDVGHSDEQYWGPDSNIMHSDEFYWGAEPVDDAIPSSNINSSDEFYWGNDGGR